MATSLARLAALLLGSLLAMASVHCRHVRPRYHKMRTSAVDAGVMTFDWRRAGVISPVADQSQADHAQAVVIAEGVESLHAIFNRLVSLSRQQVLDCCDDGLYSKDQGYKCVSLIGGLCSAYTYKSSGGKCGNWTCRAIGKVTETGRVPRGREDLMRQAIHRTPLSAGVDASQESFQFYTGGIYSSPNCSSTQLDHLVQVVGYGTASNGQEYWVIKNSWGLEWGENGYMRIVRGQNMCGIASDVFYPVNHEYSQHMPLADEDPTLHEYITNVVLADTDQ